MDHLDPVGVSFDDLQESLYPFVLEAVFVGMGPDPEFFPVVPVQDQIVPLLRGDLLEVFDGLLRLLKWDGITQEFGGGEDRQNVPVLFGQIMTQKLFVGKPGIFEMGIVHDGILHPGLGYGFGKMRFPDPFRQPHPRRLGVEFFFQESGQFFDLAPFVLVRDDRQDRLVIPAGEHLYLTPLNHGFQLLHGPGMISLHPLDQDPGEMQADLEPGVSFQYLQKGKIAVGEGIFEHVFKIADGLMVVNDESEFDFLHMTLPWLNGPFCFRMKKRERFGLVVRLSDKGFGYVSVSQIGSVFRVRYLPDTR
jgi:hypothetical protein